MRLLLSLFLTIILFTLTSLAITPPTSYCKCICFQNSTIIPLNSPPDTSSSSSSSRTNLLFREDDTPAETGADTGGKKHHTLTCNDCNRAFCLDYNLPICKNAKEEDVFATCFQRDSLKDRTIVTIFLLATAGLLLWALLKPFIVTPSTSELVQKYGDRMGLNVGGGESDGLPGPGASSGSGSGGRGGFGRDVSLGNRPRTGNGARGSISRQGGLNS